MSATEQDVHVKTEAHLQEVLVNQLTWKPGAARNAAVRIVKHALECEGVLWPDEVDLDTVHADDRNCIGTAYKNLAKQGILEHGASFRRSRSEGSRGRTIFSYRLASRARAELFLRRNLAEVKPTQMDLL